MIKNKKRFISLEGCDGSGKTTILNRLKKEFPEFVFTREPGGTEITQGVRNIIVNNPDAHVETLISLLAVSRLDSMLTNVKPGLEAGKVVISDRWQLSCYAYQLTHNGKYRTLEFMRRLAEANRYATKYEVPEPYYIFLDLDPEIGIARKKNNNQELNKFDELSIEQHREARDSYLYWLREGELGVVEEYIDRIDEIDLTGTNAVIIDASKSEEEVYQAVVKVIKSII